MQTIQRSFSFILILIFLSAGLPVFSPEDVNRDGEVCLKDAVLSIISLAQTAEKPAKFTSDIKNTLSALQIAAGLKTVIKKKADDKEVSASNTVYLISSYHFQNFSDLFAFVHETEASYISDIPLPNYPPPRYAA